MLPMTFVYPMHTNQTIGTGAVELPTEYDSINLGINNSGFGGTTAMYWRVYSPKERTPNETLILGRIFHLPKDSDVIVKNFPDRQL